MASVFLVVALLVGGAHPAHAASTTLSATCDSWSVSLLDYDADYPNKVMIEIDDIIVVDDAGFSAGFIVGGEWPGFKATHPPTTTTTRASTTTTTRVPAADAQKTAELPVSPQPPPPHWRHHRRHPQPRPQPLHQPKPPTPTPTKWNQPTSRWWLLPIWAQHRARQ